MICHKRIIDNSKSRHQSWIFFPSTYYTTHLKYYWCNWEKWGEVPEMNKVQLFLFEGFKISIFTWNVKKKIYSCINSEEFERFEGGGGGILCKKCDWGAHYTNCLMQQKKFWCLHQPYRLTVMSLLTKNVLNNLWKFQTDFLLQQTEWTRADTTFFTL